MHSGQYNHLMLELAGVSAADGDHAAVDVQLADDRHAAFQLRAEGLRRAATQPQEADQNVLLRILVGQERLPAAISHVVPTDHLHLDTCVFVKVATYSYSLCPERCKATTLHGFSHDNSHNIT